MVGKDSELSAAYRFLNEMDAQALSAEAQEPHSVIAHDAMTESYLVKGPFVGGGTAQGGVQRGR
ncbi:MAG TPA: hypothetical protein VGN19_09000, partial [Pedococcus sp.]|nr:hypothetical protein [Pedococcus sp.]